MLLQSQWLAIIGKISLHQLASLSTKGKLPVYLRPSYFNDTLILVIFVSMDLAHINFSDFTKNYSLFKQ